MAEALTVEEIATRAEHPALNKAAREAKPFMFTWLKERILDEGATVFLGDVYAKDAEAWQSGWRPQALVEGK